MRPIYMGCIPQDDDHQRALGIGQYAGSVKGICQRCGAGVWIGPRQSAMLCTEPSAVVICLGCAALAVLAEGAEMAHLGNKAARSPNS